MIKGELRTDAKTIEHYSRDASIFQVKPAAVCFPKDIADLQQLVRYATEQKRMGADVTLTARNAGTCMSGGSLTESIVVDMSRYFNGMADINVRARSLTVQSGTMFRDIEKAAHEKGLYFAAYTSSHDICGIGGMLGNNASGERSVKHGPTSANVDSLKVLLADGNVCEFGPLNASQIAAKMQQPNFEGRIYREMTKLLDDNQHLIDHSHPRVKKNAAGYALWELWDSHRRHLNLGRLFIGAQGTLGIITEADLRLTVEPKHLSMVLAPIANLSSLAAVVKTMLASGPETCETYDHNTYELAQRYFPGDARRAQAAAGKHIVVFAIYAGDSAEQAQKHAMNCQKALTRGGFDAEVINDQATVDSHLLIRRKSFKMLLDHPRGDKHALAFLEDTIVPIENYDKFLGALEAILQDYDMTYTYAGHIGDGSIRLIPLVDVDSPQAAQNIIDLATRVYELVFAFGGSISADHNDGLIRTPFLERMYGAEMVTLFARVKELFDPFGIFNPGKKVGGSLDYTREHIARD